MDRWAERAGSWTAPDNWTRVTAIDAHAEGEPLRVILSGFGDHEGETVLERRRWARAHRDGLRRALMWEPRGHADMYGCIVMPPVTAEADLSVLFTHNEGFSTMCGHGIIGVTTVLLECGLLDKESRAPVRGAGPDEVRVGIDTPAGFVEAFGRMEAGRVTGVRFRNVPSFAARLDAEIEVHGVGVVRYDLAYGGAYYAYVDADAFGLSLVPGEAGRLIDLGSRIRDAVQQQAPPVHPQDPDLGFMYGTIFVGPAHDARHHSRNVCVFAEGEIDRSPTGTGVSGRLALHHARAELEAGEGILIESLLGTCFGGVIVDVVSGPSGEEVRPEVSGRAWITGRSEWLIAPDDPLGEGFLVR